MKELDFQNISDQSLRINFEIIQDAVKDLEDRITSGSGAPSGGKANDLYIDSSASKLYVNVNGVWKYTNLI